MKKSFRSPSRHKKLRYIDCENEFNKKTLSILEKKKDDLVSFDIFKHKYNISKEIFQRYLKLGRFKRYRARPDAEIKNQRQSCIIDINDEHNIQSIKNLRSLDQHSALHDKLIRAKEDEHVYANITQLAEFGISDYAKIFKAIESGQIDGKIKK